MSKVPTLEEAIVRAKQLCEADGFDWQGTSAQEASDYIVLAEYQLKSEQEEPTR